jgi:hypothetical protein
VGCLAPLASWRLCPSLLQAHVNGRVDNAGAADVHTGQKHEFAFLPDAVGLDFGLVVHAARSIDRIGKQIKIVLVGRAVLCAPFVMVRRVGGQRSARPTNDRDFHAQAEFAKPKQNDFAVGALCGEVEMAQIHFNPDAAAVETDAGDGRGAAAQKGIEDEVAGVCGGEQAAFDQRDGFLGGMFACCFSSAPGAGKVQMFEGSAGVPPAAFGVSPDASSDISFGGTPNGATGTVALPENSSRRQTVFICLPVTAFMAA